MADHIHRMPSLGGSLPLHSFSLSRKLLPLRTSSLVRLICLIIAQESLQLPLHLTWRRGPDMPFGMSGPVQSVVVQGKFCVGGGVAHFGGDDYRVMMYDISSGTWATLPSYRACSFAMTVINHHLVLVGGEESGGGYSKAVGVWEAAWSHPYPDMPTARENPSVVVSNNWLVVAGGVAGGRYSTSVEVLNTDSKQWYAGPPTPSPWSDMKTAVVGDVAYFMGGVDGGLVTNRVYHLSIQTLISHVTSSGTNRCIWKEIPGLQLTNSTPLSTTGSLLAVGGKDKDRKATTTIHHYQPDTGVWVKVGDLPSPRYNCTCAMTTDREVLVAGGRQDEPGMTTLERVDLALITQQ